ncbi:hypothetical protein BDZ97DRAFT_49398 [Flammula alnicola]|nr:hypothetical protein BDZ97DRAFT_49398 [Flammula alnicola]
MLHFYDSSPFSLKTQEERLASARVLSHANIRSLVWGEDALAFIYFVPTCLFDLQLIVADQDLQVASTVISDSLPYNVFAGLDETHAESIFIDRSRPSSFPHSICLKREALQDEHSVEDPIKILVHPQSQFHCTVDDYTCSVSLRPFPDDIRFLTRTAFLDSMIATYLDPPTGQQHSKMTGMLKVWMEYLVTYTLRNKPAVLPDGTLEREHEEVLRSLRPENQPFFEEFIRPRNGPRIWIDHVKRRREVLEKLGKYDDARRPLPRPFPQNSATTDSLAVRHTRGLPNQKRSYSTSAFRGTQSVVSKLVRLIR